MRERSRQWNARHASQRANVELEMKIMKYRQLAPVAKSDDLAKRQVDALVSELEKNP
jgi:hypothetical protein